MRHSSLVAAFGIPHNPHFPTWVKAGHPLAEEIEASYRPLREAFERARPDTLIYITSDASTEIHEHEPRLEWHAGVPVVGGAAAWFVADVVDRHPTGDHSLFVGEVRDFAAPEPEGAPLVFHRSHFAHLIEPGGVRSAAHRSVGLDRRPLGLISPGPGA